MLPAMILRPEPPLPRPGTLPDTPCPAPAAVPAWLRRGVPDAQGLAGKGVEDMALVAGAALGALDAGVRRQERWAGVWRQRLALGAAAATARQMGRVEDEAALRDAVLLTRPDGDAGPPGRLLLAWRRLAARPAQDLLTVAGIAAVLEEFGYAGDDEAAADLADDLRQLGTGAGTVEMLAGALTVAERHGFARAVGSWLADALLAQRLGWTHAVPLLGTGAVAGAPRLRRDAATGVPGAETRAVRTKALLAGQAHAALRAIDLSAELGRRADKLLAVAPRLRARGAEAVVERLLEEDALVASRGGQKTGMSDRGLRRLFERLVELGAVRELSGRPSFRIYGL